MNKYYEKLKVLYENLLVDLKNWTHKCKSEILVLDFNQIEKKVAFFIKIYKN